MASKSLSLNLKWQVLLGWGGGDGVGGGDKDKTVTAVGLQTEDTGEAGEAAHPGRRPLARGRPGTKGLGVLGDITEGTLRS